MERMAVDRHSVVMHYGYGILYTAKAKSANLTLDRERLRNVFASRIEI